MPHPIRSVRKAHLWFGVYRDRSPRHDYRWTLYAGNNHKIANSGEGYQNVADCLHAINLVAGSNGVPIKPGRGVVLPNR